VCQLRTLPQKTAHCRPNGGCARRYPVLCTLHGRGADALPHGIDELAGTIK
jgi:hypothetical protein